jgi:hypothetical protein
MLARFIKEIQGREKMTRNKKNERRQYPRIAQELPLKVVANGYDFITATQNVSCVGTSCQINRYLPPFTRVMVRLTLPVVTDKINKNYCIECKGVVVRSEDAKPDGFNIAVFFNEINEEQRKKISQYISQFLPKNSSVLIRA